MHYILKVSRYTNIVYTARYLVLIYRKTFFNSLLLFSYVCWSVNCMSWISKFNNFFLKCTETEARFIFEGFKHCPLWKVYFQYFYTFLVFLSGLQIVQGSFSTALSVSKLYALGLWIIEHISEVSKNVSINSYLRPYSIAIHGKFYLYCLYHLRFLSSVNCKNLICKLCIPFSKCQDRQTLFILECI